MTQLAAETPVRQSFARDLVALTKPRIISLLLVTTIAPRYVSGSPSWQ
jgi:protoheme IX farnesyltransferase